MQSVNPFLKVMVKGYRFLLPINPEQHNSDVRWESIKSDLLKSLTHRPFALLWSGQTVSRLGDSLYRIAMAWWVLEETGSAAPKGTVLVFSTVPM